MRLSKAEVRATVCLTVVVGLLLACGNQDGAEQPRPVDQSKEAEAPTDPAPERGSWQTSWFLVATGNEQGFIRPCGCSKPALGGIHRRATYLKNLRAEHPNILLVSTGDVVVAADRQQQIKFEHFLLAMSAMEYQAMAIGLGELKLGLEYLVPMRDFAMFPLVATNLYRDGARPFEGSVNLEGSPLTLISLLPSSTLVTGCEVRPAAEELKDQLSGVPEGRELLVLWSGTDAELVTLLEQVPDAARQAWFVIGGTADQPIVLREVRDGRAVTVGTKGRYLAEWNPAASAPLNSVRLEENIPLDPDADSILESYRESVKAEGLLAQVPREQIPHEYAGETSCAECHEDINLALDDSGHERAWATLIASNDQHDPECVRCHVTGWGHSTGFSTGESTPHLVDVNCEACHGPGEEHASIQTPMPRSKPSEKFCLRCHDADNSPQFDFKTYWPKIKHPVK